MPLLEHAVALGASDPAILIELARSYRLSGRPQKAVAVLEPAKAGAAEEPQLRRELARARLESGDYATAVAETTSLIEHLDLSAVQSHELPEVVELYETAAEAARGVGNTIRAAVLYEALYSILHARNRRDLAAQIRELEQQRAEAYERRQEEGKEHEDQQAQTQVDSLLTTSRRQRRDGHFFAALDACYTALSLDWTNLRPFLEIAESYRQAAQPTAALTLARSVAAVAALRGNDEDHQHAQRLLARLSGDQAFQQMAIARWLESGDKEGATADLWELANDARKRGNWAVVREALERLLAIDPARADAVRLLADAVRELGDPAKAAALLADLARRQRGAAEYTEAFATWRQAISLQPDDATARQEFGELLIQRGQLAEGAQELAWAAGLLAKSDSDRAAASYLRLSQLYDGLDDIPSALRMFDRVLRTVPGRTDVQEQFIGFCLRRGRPDLAARTLRSLATYLLSAKQHKDAVATLTQLNVLQPDEPWPYEELARILVQQGKPSDAVLLYRRLAERRPTDPDVHRRLAEISEAAAAAGMAVPPEG